MKFEKLTDALKYARLEDIRYGHRTYHDVIKTRYWNMEQWTYVPCYTVVLVIRK